MKNQNCNLCWANLGIGQANLKTQHVMWLREKSLSACTSSIALASPVPTWGFCVSSQQWQDTWPYLDSLTWSGLQKRTAMPIHGWELCQCSSVATLSKWYSFMISCAPWPLQEYWIQVASRTGTGTDLLGIAWDWWMVATPLAVLSVRMVCQSFCGCKISQLDILAVCRTGSLENWPKLNVLRWIRCMDEWYLLINLHVFIFSILRTFCYPSWVLAKPCEATLSRAFSTKKVWKISMKIVGRKQRKMVKPHNNKLEGRHRKSSKE